MQRNATNAKINKAACKTRKGFYTFRNHRRWRSTNGIVTACVVFLLICHGCLLAYEATRMSPTLNEPAHLASGLAHWTFSRFDLYAVNPPLVRMVAALPVLGVGYKENWNDLSQSPARYGNREEFIVGEAFVTANGARSLWLIILARWACIPLIMWGGVICFFWSYELWGNALAGFISLSLWCFDPNILAHGSLITPDCCAASFGLTATYCFWRWLRVPTWCRTSIAGGSLGLALLTKTTWVVMFGLWPLILLYWMFTQRYCICIFGDDGLKCNSRTVILKLAVILLIGLYVLNCGYAFDETCTRLGEYKFVSRDLIANGSSGVPSNRFSGTLLEGIPLPIPKQYILGIDLQKYDFETCNDASYLLGEWKTGGWWYYYLVGLAVKLPHGSQALIAFALLAMFGRYRSRDSRVEMLCFDSSMRDICVLLAPPITVLFLVSLQLRFNHHIRYVLPTLGFVFVFAGASSSWCLPSSQKTSAIS